MYPVYSCFTRDIKRLGSHLLCTLCTPAQNRYWNNQLLNICFIIAQSEYSHTSDVGACCVSPSQPHEGCDVHSSFAIVSDATCKAACDNDPECKGYAIHSANGGMFCRIATSPSRCPYNWNTFSGTNGPLDANANCQTQYAGCYIKQNGNFLLLSMYKIRCFRI